MLAFLQGTMFGMVVFADIGIKNGVGTIGGLGELEHGEGKFILEVVFHSPAFTKIIASSFVDILKLVCLIFFKIGLTDFIIPSFLASTITPKIPIIFKPIFSAVFLAFKSSIISRLFSISTAKAIALASPLSTKVSKNL